MLKTGKSKNPLIDLSLSPFLRIYGFARPGVVVKKKRLTTTTDVGSRILLYLQRKRHPGAG